MAVLDTIAEARIQHALDVLCRKASPAAAYLFGSRADGTADEWSDYDLAVFIYGAETWGLQQLVRFCAEIQRDAGDDIELHVFAATQMEHPEPASFAAYVIKHGIRLPLAQDGA